MKRDNPLLRTPKVFLAALVVLVCVGGTPLSKTIPFWNWPTARVHRQAAVAENSIIFTTKALRSR